MDYAISYTQVNVANGVAMFGMNAKDAQGLIEDLHILENQRRSADAKRETQQYLNQIEEDKEVAEVAVQIIKGKNAEIARLQAELGKAHRTIINETGNRNELVCVATGAVAALHSLLTHITATTGEPPSQVLDRAKIVFSKFYDAKVEEYLRHNGIPEDPRLNGKAERLALYVPGASSI